MALQVSVWARDGRRSNMSWPAVSGGVSLTVYWLSCSAGMKKGAL